MHSKDISHNIQIAITLLSGNEPDIKTAINFLRKMAVQLNEYPEEVYIKKKCDENLILHRALYIACERIKGDSALSTLEVEEVFLKEARKKYAFYVKYGRNPEAKDLLPTAVETFDFEPEA